METSWLFRDEGIEIDTSYLNTYNEYGNESQPLQLNINETQSEESEQLCEESDPWLEIEECPAGVMDTLLVEPDVSQDYDNIISFAPGEGNRPLGLFVDQNSEYLSFPSIFCGKKRSDKRQISVQYSTICKWELRSQDRRVAESVPNIFTNLRNFKSQEFRTVLVYQFGSAKRKVKNTPPKTLRLKKV